MALPCERYQQPGQGGEAACLLPWSPAVAFPKNTRIPGHIGTNIQISYTLQPFPIHTHTLFPGLNGAPEATVHFRYFSFFSWFSYAKHIQPSVQSPQPGVLSACTSPCSTFISQTSALPCSALPLSPRDGQHFWPNSNSFISTLTFPFNLLCLDTLHCVFVCHPLTSLSQCFSLHKPLFLQLPNIILSYV